MLIDVDVQLHVCLFLLLIFVSRPVGLLVHFHVSQHVHLHVDHHVSHNVGHHDVILTLCEGSEMLTEWKSESVTYGRTFIGTGVGASD